MLVVLVAVLAVGCSSDPGHPRTLPNLTASPTPSPTPTVSDLAAAADVVRRYYALLNAETTLANANALAELMTSSCKCQEVAESTRRTAARNQHYFGKIRVTSMVPTLDGDAAADVLVHYDYTRSGVADSDGHVVRSSPGRAQVGVDFRLVHVKTKWLIAQIDAVSPGQTT